MRFTIRRSSDFRGVGPPHPAAVQTGVDEGGRPTWGIDVGTLDELLALSKALGNPIIVDATEGDLDIEIYDDYRE